MLIFTSCKKGDTGDTGPAGATGPTGPQGNANVKNYSITIQSSNWQWDNLYNQWFYRDYTFVDDYKSAVYGYILSGNGKEAMPYYNQLDLTTTTFANNLFRSPSYIQFEYYNGTTTLAAPASDMVIYLVVIPPAFRIANPNINWKNYNEVERIFHLRETRVSER